MQVGKLPDIEYTLNNTSFILNNYLTTEKKLNKWMK